MIKKINVTIVVIILYSIAQFETQAQDQSPPKNLMYAAENLVFEDIIAIGNFKLLRITPNNRQNKRFVYLLNKVNLVVDTMKVNGNDHYLIRNDSNFSIRGLGDYVDISIKGERLSAKGGFQNKSIFSDETINPIFPFNNQIFGRIYIKEIDREIYTHLTYESIITPSYLNNKSELYNYYQLDTLPLLDETTVFLKNKSVIPKEDLIKPVISQADLEKVRITPPYYGWNSFSLLENSLFMYERKEATIYQLDVENDFGVLNSIELPIDNNTVEGWKYLFDYTKKEHYAVKRIKQVNEEEATSKRKKRKQKVTYEYVLYQLNFNQNTVKPLFKLGFDPKMVDNALVYEIVQESKKGSAIFFHPLDPNYNYKKTVFLDY
jgi:hypothetical protein